jgi:RNA-binding protein
MENLKGWQKQFLRSEAHHLKPLVYIGKQGITPGLITAINTALDDHELIKVKFVDLKDEKKDITKKILEEVDCIMPGNIGNTLILYRENTDESKKKIFIPKKK